jgi:hypothetical protein
MYRKITNYTESKNSGTKILLSFLKYYAYKQGKGKLWRILVPVLREPLSNARRGPGRAQDGLTGANTGKFTGTALAKNYTFWPSDLLLRQA